MAKFKPGGIRIGAELWRDIVLPLTSGLVATDGVQYSAVATVGTTAVNILQTTIDPGFTIGLQAIEVGLTQQFTGLNGSFVASTNYYWTAQPIYTSVNGTTITGTTINITGTIARSVGTLLASEDTFSGFVPVGSVPFAPIRLTLTAIDRDRAIGFSGRVKNSSYVRLVGHIIPGT